MTAEIFAILIATVVSVILGFIWYHPRVFGTVWMRLAGLSPERVAAKNRMPLYAIGGFVAALVMAFVLDMQLFGETDPVLALLRSFWLWLGFIAPVALGSVLWEGRSLRLYLINAGYWFTSVILMTLIFTYLS